MPQSHQEQQYQLHHLDSTVLKNFLQAVFTEKGYDSEQALVAANVLLQADLSGIDSHGVARLSGYLRQIKEGKIKIDAQSSIERSTPSTANLDGDQGLGLLSAQEGMKLAIDKAKNAGSGWVAIKNSSHFGIAAAHAMLALEEDMIGFAMTNASPLVTPAGGVEAKLGTNPICYAIPAGKEHPVIVDMATTTVANGKLEIASRKGEQVPEGWAQDAKGHHSRNPNALKDGGTLLPLGSDLSRSSYKGYALGSAVDIFSGVLSGANFGPWVPPFVTFLDQKQEKVGEGIGHFLGAWRVDGFRPVEEFKDHMNTWIQNMKQTKTNDEADEVLIPGEPEFREKQKREYEGIPVVDEVYQQLLEIQAELRLEKFF